MYAITKTIITEETAQTLITAHCGAEAKIQRYTELTDGMYNAAYLVELTDGHQSVLKVAPPDVVKVLRYEQNIMQAEVEVLRLISAETDVPVPDVFAYDTSRRLIDNDYYLMAYVPGVSMHSLRRELSVEDQRAIDFCTGEYLRQINGITGTHFGYFGQPDKHCASWRQAFDGMLCDILQDGREAGVDLPMPYDDVYAQLSAHYAVLDEITHPVLVHWDLWDGNIFIDPASKTITGILDCERALWGDPLMEVNFGPFGHNQALFQGYGADLLATPAAKTRRTLYNVYLCLIMVIECTYRQYENDNQLTWVTPKLVEEIGKLVS